MEDIELKENERIDDLELNGLKIIQNKEGFRYGMDSVLLSDLAKEIKKDSMVLDLCSGNGIIGLLLCGKTKLKNIIGIEVQADVCEMATRSILYNHLQDKFQMVRGDIKNIESLVPAESFDAITCNPPYKKENSGIINESQTKLIARHEVLCNLEDVVKAGVYCLKDKGSFYIVHRPERLADLFYLLRHYKLEPKVLRFVQPKINKKPNLILIKAIKNGNSFLDVKEPIIVYNEDGSYTKEIYQIYGREK